MSTDAPEPIRVFLIEHDSRLRATIGEFLARQTDVCMAGTTNGAPDTLAQLAVLQPQVILLDLHMQSRFALDAIPYLRRLSPQARIILMTLFDQSASRQAALGAGADELVCKSDVVTELMPIIRSVLQKPIVQS